MTMGPTKKGRDGSIARAVRATALPWLVLATAVPASFYLFAIIQNSVEDVARLRFEREANNANAIITRRLRSYTDVLYALRALFASDDGVDRLRFHYFVESLDLKRRYPGFIALNYAAFVPDRDRKRFEESVRRDTSLDPRGYPQFAIKPPGKRSEYYVIVYVEPMAGYEFAFGLDIASNPMAANPEKVAAAVRLHRDTGNLTASSQPLRVNQERQAVYLAMRLAVYRKGIPANTVEQRRDAYLGSVGAGFDIDYMMKGALGEEMPRRMRLRLYDAGSSETQPRLDSPEEKHLLFDADRPAERVFADSATGGSPPEFVRVLPVEIAGRIWEFEYSAPRSAVLSDTDKLLPPSVLAGGLLSSLLLFSVLYSLSHSRSQAIRLAHEMTRGLRDSTEQLQAVSRRLVDVQESDRRQFSRELHDRVGQNLTALSISLDILKTHMAGNADTAVRSRLDDAAALLESTAGVIENVMSELRPPMLDDYGLLPALQWYANAFSGRTGIDVTVHGDEGIQRLPQASEIALFRIVQEALTNVAKHAQARHVDIHVAHTGAEFVMSVSDDGVGLDPVATSTMSRRQGLGMVTMRERTQAVGGQFEIGSGPGRGTRLVVRVPS
jgi:signal transduction histidine kinase